MKLKRRVSKIYPYNNSFQGTPLKGATFAECVLSHADFRKTDLRGAKFIECNLTGSDFTGAVFDDETEFVDCDLAAARGLPKRLKNPFRIVK